MFKRKFKKIYKEKLRKLKRRFQNILENEKNKFTRILRHDVKTPLLAQSQALKMLSSEKFGTLNSKQKEIIDEILNSNNILLDIVINTIFLSCFENSSRALKLENINIYNEIKNICGNIKNYADIKQQNIIIKANKEIELRADRELIQKIIFNLITSSVSYGFENSDIIVGVKENKNSISFYTKNKSIYMTKEKINSMFENKKGLSDFNQLGANLNLNIAQKLIQAHHWKLLAQSNKDNSSVLGFVVKK